ncbi:MAG: HAD family hydrolase [Pseudomonadota bacterium]
MTLLDGKRAVLLDMNSTFMFGEDRFGPDEDYAATYRRLYGRCTAARVNALIADAYAYLDRRYPDPAWRERFPTVAEALLAVAPGPLANPELGRLVDTFACYEVGHIPPDYAAALRRLARRYRLGAVVDIWAPKRRWEQVFEDAGVGRLFPATAFSSDSGVVKPSPRPFLDVMDALGVALAEALVVGDSVRRDLGGARAAGVDCVLVGDARHDDALACFDTLLDFVATTA